MDGPGHAEKEEQDEGKDLWEERENNPLTQGT
jgi:hypothetical protein